MSDQATNLRNIINKKEVITTSNNFKIFTVTSGKGGVGKSNFSANLALALNECGKRVIILDADFGLSNIDLILGVRPKYNLAHVILEELPVKEIITHTPYGISFISGGTGIKEMLFLDKFKLEQIAYEISELSKLCDVLLIDTGAGINDTVIKFSEMADEICLIITPDPSSITDAYALLKTFTQDFMVNGSYNVVLNRVDTPAEGMSVFKKISTVSASFLDINLKYTGYIPFDTQLIKAVKTGKPIYYINKDARSSIQYNNIAKKLLSIEQISNRKETLVDKLKRILVK
ncbi:MAG: hypothetical protein BEN19_05945 [Epulopiscium sp. Nuni2H_MBin003]|nr:MAG: hypothetical protein BEN19_05945 [Epulopiscium sp. Nuni2H_MBin003]